MRHLLMRRWWRLAVLTAALFALAAGIAYATIPDGGKVYTACMLKNVGTIRLIDPSLPAHNLMSHCTPFETQVTWNQQGQAGAPGPQGPPGVKGDTGDTGPAGPQGPKGDTGDAGAAGAQGPKGDPGSQGPAGPQGQAGTPGPGNTVFSGSVNPDGSPQVSGFTVQHTAGSGLYRMDFPAGSFSGSAGKFLIATVTPIGPSTNVEFASSIAPIASDGSGSFEVQFAGGDTLFTFVVAVSITPGSTGNVFSGSVNPDGSPQVSGFTVQHTAGSGLYRMDFPAGTFSGWAGRFLIAAVTPIGNTYVEFASSIAPIASDGSGSFEVQFAGGDTLFTFVVSVAGS